MAPGAIAAEFAGQPLTDRQHVSKDRDTVTLFYSQHLPASARDPFAIGDINEDGADDMAVGSSNDGVVRGGSRHAMSSETTHAGEASMPPGVMRQRLPWRTPITPSR